MANDTIYTEVQSQTSPSENSFAGIFEAKSKRHHPRGYNLPSALQSPLKAAKQEWNTAKQNWNKGPPRQRAIIEKTPLISISMLWHLTSIVIGIIIVSLNLRGCFIGFKFAATHHERTQTLSMLALQVCAKIIEIIALGSLGLIISDFLHHFLLFDSHGLPIGLSGAKISFGNILYVFSPAFWSGVFAFRARRVRAMAAILIIVCGLLATFIGPSSALLLIPTVRDDWLAGQAQFYQYGQQYPLYPTRLDASTADLAGCSQSEVLQYWQQNKVLPDSIRHCPWYTVSDLMDASRFTTDAPQDTIEDTANGQQAVLRNITVYDRLPLYSMPGYGYDIHLRRAITYTDLTLSSGVWAITGLTRINVINSQIHKFWIDAISWAGSLLNSAYYARYYFLRINGGDSAVVETLLPAVQTQCLFYENTSFNETSSTVFPALPYFQNGTWPGWEAVLNATEAVNTVTSSWLDYPGNYTHDPNSTLRYFPSAALFVQIPRDDSEESGSILACSSNAWWAKGQNMFSDFRGDRLFSSILFGNLNSWLPVNDGTWKFIELSVPWLETMSFHADSAPGLQPIFDTTAANDLISWFIMKNSSDPTYYFNNDLNFTQIHDAFVDTNSGNLQRLELFLSSIIANAIANLNTDQNFRDDSWQDQLPAGQKMDDLYPLLLADSYQWPNVSNSDTGESENLTWTIRISGFAMIADSIGAYLAVAVVLIVMLFSLSHMVYMLRKRLSSRAKGTFSRIASSKDWSSDVWGRPDEILALALESPQTTLKPNTGPWRKLFRRDQSRLMLRAHSSGHAAMRYDSKDAINLRTLSRQDSYMDDDSGLLGERVFVVTDDHATDCRTIKVGKLYD